MAEEYYFTVSNGTSGGCAIMHAQFIRLPRGGHYKHTYTKLFWTEKLVQSCGTEKEAVEFFKQLPRDMKIG